jgi:pyruvate dehydrogenase E2 component (dihydrolipoyllysine-residue acetyltransferase)
MATEIKLPRLGQGMESGTIVKWLKSEGDQVEKGEPLYELDTDKVTQEVEADASGVLLKIAVAEGEVEVGRTIAVLGEQGEEVSVTEEPSTDGGAARPVEEDRQEEGSPASAREEERERGRSASAGPEEQVTEIRAADSENGGRIKASPLARRIARERGIDLSAVAGTGPEGRVVAEDVERAAASAPAPPVAAPRPITEGVEVQQLSSMRKTIARRLTEAWQAPVFQLGVTVDMARALELRQRLVELHGNGTKPTISDLITKVCAAALMRHRAVNALYKGDSIELHPTANIGIAVAIPNGLVVPVIRSCERLSIAEIAAARAAVVDRARAGKLQQADLEDGTFSISNLGMYGIERFIAVLNPPQAAILAVGSTEDRVVAVDGAAVVRPRMELTLTCDHRAVDGATGADFLRTVKSFLEEPGLAL